MAGGEVQKIIGTLVSESVTFTDPVLELPEVNTIECCFQLTALADNVGTDRNKNDRWSEFFQQGLIVTSSALFLEKKVGGVWTEVKTLNDDSFGTLSPFGQWSIANRFNSIGYILDWTLVLQHIDLGEGVYRIRCDHTLIDTSTSSEYGCEVCLLTYTAERAESTVRFEWYLNGLHGNNKTRTSQINYGDRFFSNGLGWFNQIRLSGFFGFETRSQEQEFRQFKNKARQQLTNTQTPTFTCFLDEKFLNMEAHLKLMRMFQSSWCYVTDYNQNVNPDTFVQFPVLPVGEYSPEYFRGNKNSKVTLEFEQKYNVHQWKPC